MFKRKKAPAPTLNYDAYQKSWYFGFVDQWRKEFERNAPDIDQQNAYLEELLSRIKANANNHNLQLLNSAEVARFWKGVGENLHYIEDQTIFDYPRGYNPSLKEFLLRLKGTQLVKKYEPNDISIMTKAGAVFSCASQRDIFVEMMSYNKKNRRLTIIGCVTFPFNQATTKLVANINGKSKPLRDSGIYSDYKVFGETAYHKFPFRIEVALDPNAPLHMSFQLVDRRHSTQVDLKLNFNTYMSKLGGRVTYWRFDNFIATHSKQVLTVKQSNPIETFLREFVYLFVIIFGFRRPRTAALRVFYWLSKPVLGRRNIWLFADKIYKAGDNAEWLYRYAITQQDGAHKYYALRHDVPDARRFEKDGVPYLKYKTLKQRLLFLHSKIVVFTHNNAPGYYRFGGVNEVYFRGLYNYSVMYVQHGLTVQDTAWLFKRSVDDFTRFFVASKFETNNLLRPAYGYKPSEIIKTGATRYDGLINNDKKNILITPTWRTYLAPPGKDYGESRDANNLFKNSDFYKIYNSLITNKKLLSTAKRLGYSITYLIHPVMSSQINDFDHSNEAVRIIAANDNYDYNQGLSEASLMITDYSGVQFDFAYLRKPVVYFHPPELPPSYDEAVYKYSKHALGDIHTKVNALVDSVCEYMENECKLKPKYKKRIDDFFYHNDRNNSKRTYNAIIKWQRENGTK